MPIENFIEARTSRRRIINQLKEQQIDDSCCFEKLTQHGLDTKKKLLTLLAEWLTTFGANKQLVDNDWNVLARIAGQRSIEDWLAAQSREADLIERSRKAKEVEEEAYKIYDQAAPCGFVSIYFKEEGEKEKAKRLQKEYELAKAAREKVDVDLHGVRTDIGKMIGCFLRDFLKPESLDVLTKESSIKQELKDLFRQCGEKAKEVWGPYSAKQFSSLCELEREIRNLTDFYSSAPVVELEKLIS